MTDDLIPEEARLFLLNSIDSVAQWEGLLLLRSDTSKAWSADDIARHLYIDENEVGRLLIPLAERGFLARDGMAGGHYRYAPATEALDALTGRVASLYRQYLIPVTHIIHSKGPINRMQAFADAFRIRKD